MNNNITYCNVFNRMLILKYKKAYAEKNIEIVKINANYAIYPASYYNTISQFGYTKNIDFIFIGDISANERQKRNREWVGEFANKYFTNDSYLKYSKVQRDYVIAGIFDKSLIEASYIPRNVPGELAEHFDNKYYKLLANAKFCLCPAGDCPWSMRFYEAIMCKCIPIVKYSWETWRSSAESRLNYKYYLADDKEFVYREDWVEHNYTLFMKFHTLEKSPPINKIEAKCVRDGCNYKIHSKIGKGKYCCMACKNLSLGVHGPRCERVFIQTAKAIS